MSRSSRRSDSEICLLADVGGTYVRFAVLKNGTLGPIAHMAVADHARFDDALNAFLARQPDHAAVHSAVFGVAGVVEGGRCALTNNPWVVDTDALRADFGFTDIRLVNDFEAIAWSLPKLTRSDLRKIGGGEAQKAPMVVLGPGTGLGVAAYVPHAQGGLVLHSEGGHMTLPGASAREDAVLEVLRLRFGHVSAERVLSARGLGNLYGAIASLDSVFAPERSSVEITQAALAGSCAICCAAVDMFCAMLGEVAGNFALSFAARGGIFLAGGIVPHLRDYLPRSQFRSRFDAKGRMATYVESIPAYVILSDDPAFIGLRSLAARQFPAG
jgi:glucokinase